MELFVLRHGQAQPRAARDADRELTPRGREQVEGVIRANRSDLARLTQLWVSPYVRARQSADLAEAVLGERPRRESSLLTPGGDVQALIDALQAGPVDSLLLVSHQPLVGELLDRLCDREPGYHPMGTASLACVDLELPAAGLGNLRWLRHAA